MPEVTLVEAVNLALARAMDDARAGATVDGYAPPFCSSPLKWLY
jgi:hypothetical protein